MGRARPNGDGGLLPGGQTLSASLFADASNFEQRFVESYDQVETIVGALKTLGLRVVLTSGSFDIIHEGHSMYLEAARRFGDFLIVGLDSDDKIRARKGPDRPAVPQMERLRMVTHQRGVGLVTLKHAQHPRWELIKTVSPDVLVATEDTYSEAEIAELESRYCTRVEVLERMATVSTSARLRRIQLGIPEPDAADGAAGTGAAGGPGAGDGPVAGGRADAAGGRAPEAVTDGAPEAAVTSGPAGALKQILLYLPVLHRGYEAFFERHRDAAGALLLGAGFQAGFPALAKDIRALAPERAAAYLRLARPGLDVRVIEPADLPGAVTGDPLVLPDEQVTRELAGRHDLGRGRELIFDRTFLRWDRDWSLAQRPARFDGAVAAGDLPRGLIARARDLAGHSSDWWRQVGAIAVRGDELLGSAWNQHYPTEYAPYADGDPRDGFSRGVRPDLSTALHAEASIIATAARDGVSLRGADLYVTTFPCPACARLIARAGLRRCYFAGPYSVLDGEDVLRAAGVELLWVDTGAGRPGGA